MKEIEHEGTLTIGHNVQIGYFAQNQASLLDENLTVFQTIDDVAKGEIRNKIRDLLGAFMFGGPEESMKKVKVLSGGERTRLAMIKLLLEPVNLLILDEPTNHLDIETIAWLENYLVNYQGALIIVSHDRYFINRVATHVLELSENGSTVYLGDYDYYVEKKAELATSQEEEAETYSQEKEVSPVNDYQAQKEVQKELRKLMRQIESLEAEIEELENQAQVISEQMHTTMMQMNSCNYKQN